MNHFWGPSLIFRTVRSSAGGSLNSRFLSRSRPLSTLNYLPRLPPRAVSTTKTMSTAAPSTESDPRPVFFFDIDNCVSCLAPEIPCDRALTNTSSHHVALLPRSGIALDDITRRTEILTRRLECNIFGHMQELISKTPHCQFRCIRSGISCASHLYRQVLHHPPLAQHRRRPRPAHEIL